MTQGRLPGARRMLKSKIHRAVITHADVAYAGSLTLDADLMARADILDHEEVHVWNVTRGTRLTTYAIKGPSGSGIVCANGAAAHLNGPGDVIIIASFITLDPVPENYQPALVFVDGANVITHVGGEVPGPQMELDEVGG